MMMDSWVEDEDVTEQRLLIIDERIDKVVSIPEYRKEIYAYLRDAEVNILKTKLNPLAFSVTG